MLWRLVATASQAREQGCRENRLAQNINNQRAPPNGQI
jgi:hypothetical protein